MTAFTRSADGTLEVSVQTLYTAKSCFLFIGWSARTDIKPRLWITDSGLRYKIFAEGHFPFAEIAQIDVRKPWLSVPRVLFLGERNRRVLSVGVADMGAAKRLIAAVPSSLPLSLDAATLRDGNPAAATKGLRRYRGAIR